MNAEAFTEVVRKISADMAAEYPRVVRWPISSDLARVLWNHEKPMRKKIAWMARMQKPGVR